MAEQARPGATATGTQLALLEAPVSPWRLDDVTREVGRRGLAEARAALRMAGGDDRTEHRSGAAEAA